MCTIDPLYCWYYDNLKYWQEHPEELKLAESLYSSNYTKSSDEKFNHMADFLQMYVRFRRMLPSFAPPNTIGIANPK